jgi:hypothetical protein
MNDSLRTDIFLRFTPETIACACIDLAARTLQVKSNRKKFFQLFHLILNRFHYRKILHGLLYSAHNQRKFII